MTRQEIVKNLKEFALEKLKVLQGYVEAKKDFEMAADAYRKLSGGGVIESDVPRKGRKIGGSNQVTGEGLKPAVQAVFDEPGKDGGYYCKKAKVIESTGKTHISRAVKTGILRREGWLYYPGNVPKADAATQKQAAAPKQPAAKTQSVERKELHQTDVLANLVNAGPGRPAEIRDRMGYVMGDQRVGITLCTLAKNKLVTVTNGDGKSTYSITKAGESYLAENIQ